MVHLSESASGPPVFGRFDLGAAMRGTKGPEDESSALGGSHQARDKRVTNLARNPASNALGALNAQPRKRGITKTYELSSEESMWPETITNQLLYQLSYVGLKENPVADSGS